MNEVNATSHTELLADAIEREIGFAKADLWIKRINDAVLAEREACCVIVYEQCKSDNVAQRPVDAIRARGTT